MRALYVYNCNPAAVAPNQAKVIKGLERDDLFVVVHELYATDTVDYADIVLPATSQLEQVDIHGSYGHHDVMLQCAGDCAARRVPVEQRRLPRAGPPARLRARALPGRRDLDPRSLERSAGTLEGITLERLREEGPVRLNIPEEFTPFAAGVFPTPSGKCELYSERMKADGFDPLPAYTPPLEDPLTRPDLAARYPLQLVSPPRPQFLNSTFANSPRHRTSAGDPRDRAVRPKMPRIAA